MTKPYVPCKTAIRAMWSANWTGAAGIVVRWHANTNEAIPDPMTTPHWLHLAIEFGGEDTAAYGSGVRARERVLDGVVSIAVMARRGIGEDTALSLLDDALDVFRGRQEGPLRFLQDWTNPDGGASVDGAWWARYGAASFTYRFLG